MASGSQLTIEKWNGEGDFEKWQWMMKAVLRRNRVHRVVFDTETLPADISSVELEEMEEWAFTTLQLAMGKNVISEISQETTAKGIWKKLEDLYMKKSLTNRLILLKTFFTYKMKEGSSIKTHLSVFDDLLMKMKSVELKVDEEQKAMILLCSLPERYTGFANSLIYGRDTLTLDDVKTGLLSEELRDQMKEFGVGDSSGGSNSSSGLFVERGRAEKKVKNYRGRSNSRKPHWRSKSKDGRCHHCKKPGHWKRDCPDLEKKTEGSSSIAMEKDDSDLLTAVVSDVADHWVLDSGASFHMTPNKDYFSSFDAKEGSSILMGNDATCKSMGVGSVRIRMYDGIVRTLSDVRYVPGLRKSLISLGQLASLGCKITIVKDGLRVSREALVLMKGVMVRNLYLLMGTTVHGELCVGVDSSKSLDATKLWHMRLGHTSEKNLELLRKKKKIKGEIFNKLNFCKECVLAKQTRVSFGDGMHTSKSVLDYVHSDV